MTGMREEAESAVAPLIESDEPQLYEQLGIRVAAIEQRPEIAGSFDPSIVFDEVAMGPLDSVRELGRRIFQRWERSAFDLVCGTILTDEGDRKSLADAFGINSTAAAALMATLLVSQFGVAPAIAAVIAAIIVKRFFRPAYQEFCTFWSERITIPPTK
jgi:hypothetical protein